MLQQSLCPFVDYISSSADKSVQLLLLDGQLVAGLRLFAGSGQIFIDTLVFDWLFLLDASFSFDVMPAFTVDFIHIHSHAEASTGIVLTELSWCRLLQTHSLTFLTGCVHI